MKRVVWRLALTSILFLSALAVILSHSKPARAQSEVPVRVVIKPLAPFVFREGDAYRGFSIDLWQEAAARMDLDYEYVYVDTVTEQLAAVEQGRADFGITGITITKEREQALDFSVPYFRSGLHILVPATGNSGQWVTPIDMLGQAFSSPIFYRTLIGLIGLIVIIGHVFWLSERGRNKDFPTSYLRGVWEGIWYTVVTLVTVGYGDRTARTVVGRLVAMGWMFISLLLVAGMTANFTSQLTLSHFQGLIQGPEDLPGKRIATVTGSTAAMYLDDRQINYQGVAMVEDAYALLESGDIDAIVYDGPVLQHYAINGGKGRVETAGKMFKRQYYGIALPNESPEREVLNRVLLGMVEDGTYDRLMIRWFGDEEN